jgi:wobble nucleotide-excising tRNase
MKYLKKFESHRDYYQRFTMTDFGKYIDSSERSDRDKSDSIFTPDEIKKLITVISHINPDWEVKPSDTKRLINVRRAVWETKIEGKEYFYGDIFLISKWPDEWFWVLCLDESLPINLAKERGRIAYKCDQFEGLIRLIQELGPKFTDY